ncbi:unnamed protein product, partial [Amoebophrya sp. A25]|eukprot:GSA25T00001534001.1
MVLVRGLIRLASMLEYNAFYHATAEMAQHHAWGGSHTHDGENTVEHLPDIDFRLEAASSESERLRTQLHQIAENAFTGSGSGAHQSRGSAEGGHDPIMGDHHGGSLHGRKHSTV